MEVETRTVSKGARIANCVKLYVIVLNHCMAGMVWVIMPGFDMQN